MTQTTVFNSPPPFESEMKPDVRPDESPKETPVGAPSQSETPVPSVDFVPFIDEVEEKKKFWKTVIITMGVFLAISVVAIGVIISQRLSQPPAKLDIQYVDGNPLAQVTPAVIITRRPTKTPTPPILPTSTSFKPIQGVTQIPVVPPRSPTIPFVTSAQTTATPQTPTTALSPTPVPGTTTTPYPTVTPIPTLLPTITNTPTPTGFLYGSVSTLDFGSVQTSTTKTFTIRNTGGSSISISSMNFATGGSIPYSFTDAGQGCIVFAVTPTPITLAPQSSRCVGIVFNASVNTFYSNGINIWWGNSSHTDVTVSGTWAVPTATPTNTPTPTP